MYNNILPYLTKEEISYSGYFEDNFHNTEILKENYTHIKDKFKILYKNQKDPIVLLITGCFAPIHNGHLETLRIAKEYFKDNYVMSVISPAHDSYVSTKTKDWNISKRLQYMEKLIFDDIVIDSVPPTTYKEEINFTHIIKRIEYALPNIRIGFVFGSDNFGFIFPFYKSNHIPICIERDISYKDMLEHRINEFNIPYIYIQENNFKSLSSTIIRNEILH